MGNSCPLSTVAVAKYMSFTKDRWHRLANALLQAAQNKSIHRHDDLNRALTSAQITSVRDVEILTLLATMWDTTGNGMIPCTSFLIGLLPLACPGQGLTTILQLAMELYDKNSVLSPVGYVSAKEAIIILKSLAATASYLGDTTLGLRQIYKVIDSAFETMVLVDETDEELPHLVAIQRIVTRAAIRKLLTGPEGDSSAGLNNSSYYKISNGNSILATQPPKLTIQLTSSEDDESQRRTQMKRRQQKKARQQTSRSNQDPPQGVPPRSSHTPNNTQQTRQYQRAAGEAEPHEATLAFDECATEVSSVLLTPLTQVPMERRRSSSVPRVQSKNVSTVLLSPSTRDPMERRRSSSVPRVQAVH